MDYLQLVNVLPDNQSAYRRLYSTDTTLCSVVNNLLVHMDEGKCSVLILPDLSAAFDTVVHNVLLQDCKNIEIEGDALKYLRSYLENRSYCVQIGTSFSNTRHLQRGIPQGSVLGPILFCVYTSELSHVLRKHGVDFKLYADDTQFYLTLNDVANTEAKISMIMKDVGNWMNSKQLKLNEDKTECLIVGKSTDLRKLDISTLLINGTSMTVRKTVKDLGVIVDCNLSFKDQINQVVRTTGYHLRNI